MSDTLDFDEFYAQSQAAIVRQIHALTGDLGEAQDIVQEAYMRAWQRWRHIQTYEQPESWVRTVAYRLAVSRWRRVRRMSAALVRSGPPQPAASPDPEHIAIVAALQRLPEAQRTTVVLHYIGDVPVEEVAHQMQCSVGTVKSRLARGRAALAQLLDPDGPSPAAGPAASARRGGR